MTFRAPLCSAFRGNFGDLDIRDAT